MTNGVNGSNVKHDNLAYVLMRMDVGETTKTVQFPLRILGKQCSYFVTISEEDHYTYRKKVACDNGHTLLVWHSPENQTYLITSN